MQILIFFIREIEFYYYSDDYPDQYVHCSQDQLGKHKWYFHKFGNGTIKNGTCKGLDICIGNESDIYCGILIRSIESDTGEFITGSCNCVNRILQEYSFIKSQYLIDHMYDLNIFNTNNPIYLLQYESEQNDVHSSPRVGLSLKYPNYLFKNFRFMTFPSKIPKYRNVFITKLLNDGYSGEDIINITNLQKRSVDKSIKEYNEGWSMSNEDALELDATKINIIYGNWLYNNSY
jgi:hypothetical protein